MSHRPKLLRSHLNEKICLSLEKKICMNLQIYVQTLMLRRAESRVILNYSAKRGETDMSALVLLDLIRGHLIMCLNSA